METEHLYAPSDEIEARALEALLRDAGLRFSLRANADTAYPGVTDKGRGWGELRVHPEDLEAAQNLVADWLESDAVDLEGQAMAAEASVSNDGRPEPARPARAVTMLLPWAVLSLSLIANWYQWDRHRLRLGTVDVHDAAGRVTATYEYVSSVEFPTELEYFDTSGQRTQRCKDADADGWYEECFVDVGERRLHDEDDDQDGRYERSRLLAGDRTLAEWHDDDGDGLFDRFADQHGGHGTDEDGDGVPNSWECANGARLDLVTCTLGE